MSEFTQSAFEGSLLSVIVYSDEIEPGMSLLRLQNVLAGELSEAEIQYFFDNFEIIDTYDFNEDITNIPELADSGYQGMLVKRKGSDDNGEPGEFWFVNRGTEVGGDVEDTFKDAVIADIDLALTGKASFQIVAMEKYFQSLLDSGAIPPNATLYAAGHSLGGHLTTYLADAHEFLIDHAFTYNGAGIDKLPDSPYELVNFMQELVDLGSGVVGEVYDTLRNILTQTLYSNIGQDNVSNFITTEGLEVVPSTNSQLGEIYKIGTEEGGHSSKNLAHSLFVHHMISELDPSLSIDDIGQLLNQSSSVGAIEHDVLINGLAEIFGKGALGEPSESNSNDTGTSQPLSLYHNRLMEIVAELGGRGFSLTPLSGLGAGDLLELLASDSTEGAVARYSVLNNLSFMVEGDFSEVTPSFMGGSTPLLRTLLKRGTLCQRSVHDQTQKI